MPAYPNIIPDWLKSENASVLDPACKRGLRKVGSLIGVDDPAGQVMGTVGPTPLVSIFRNRAAREFSTETFKQAAKALLPEFTKAADLFAAHYPRVAAHMRIVPTSKHPLSGPAPAYVDLATSRAKPRLVKVTPAGRSISEQEAQRLVFHEGAHVAQDLGNKQFGPLYGYANRMVGYGQNPFEKSARFQAGANIPRPANAIDALRKIAVDANYAARNRGEFANRDAEIALRTLADRAATKWRPNPVYTGAKPGNLVKYIDSSGKVNVMRIHNERHINDLEDMVRSGRAKILKVGK